MTKKPFKPTSAPVQRTLAPLQNAITDLSVSRAMQDLAQRSGVSVEEVSLVSVLQMEFTAQAFYCQKVKERIGREAPPEVIEGQVILLAIAGEKFEYHASGKEIIFCSRQLKLRP